MAVLIILQAFLRLITADNFHTFTGFVLTAYLMIFGIVLICIECNWRRARILFYIMNFARGKFLFYTVMTLLCFGSGATVSFFDVLVGIICAVCAIAFFFIHLWHKNAEVEYVATLVAEADEPKSN